jgi:hypothetical protein
MTLSRTKRSKAAAPQPSTEVTLYLSASDTRKRAVQLGWTCSRFLSVIATAMLLTLAMSSRSSEQSAADKSPRKQLSIGYSLLYQEADGIPKLKWLLMFKDKPEEMGQITTDLINYYQQLADTMEKLSKQYPAMNINVATMPEIEADTRKAIGEDLAKDIAPIAGKSGVKFEREALLTFYESLNEQRHLIGVMLPLETDPGLKQFLESTKTQLEQRYAKVGALLNHRYFTQ